jgi:proline iminopeptidase
MLYSIESLDDPFLPSPARLALISPAPVTKAYRNVFDETLRQRGNTPQLVAERKALNTSGLRDRDPEGYRQRLFELGVAGYFADPAQASHLTPFRVLGRVQQSVWDSLGEYDLLPGLRRLRIPSWIVQGRDDPIPAESSLQAASALETEVTLIDHCGHVPYVECPAALWGALDPFLASTDAAVGAMHD